MRSRSVVPALVALVEILAGHATVARADVAGPSTSSPTRACELFAFRGSAPLPDERGVPLDARILVAYEACESTRATISVWHEGVPLDGAAVYGWSADARWAAFKPREPLAPEASYVVVLETERGASVVKFVTGASLSPEAIDAQPSLRVLGAAYQGPRGADGRAPASFTLELSYPRSGPLGAFYLGGQKRIEAVLDHAPALVTERLALADGRSAVPVLQTVSATPGEPSCFSVLYEDAAGRLSRASEPTCAVVPGSPPVSEPAAPAAGGCTASGAPPGAAAPAALVLLGLAWRARPSRGRRRP